MAALPEEFDSRKKRVGTTCRSGFTHFFAYLAYAYGPPFANAA
jgi:hypothetical protein